MNDSEGKRPSVGFHANGEGHVRVDSVEISEMDATADVPAEDATAGDLSQSPTGKKGVLTLPKDTWHAPLDGDFGRELTIQAQESFQTHLEGLLSAFAKLQKQNELLIKKVSSTCEDNAKGTINGTWEERRDSAISELLCEVLHELEDPESQQIEQLQNINEDQPDDEEQSDGAMQDLENGKGKLDVQCLPDPKEELAIVPTTRRVKKLGTIESVKAQFERLHEMKKDKSVTINGDVLIGILEWADPRRTRDKFRELESLTAVWNYLQGGHRGSDTDASGDMQVGQSVTAGQVSRKTNVGQIHSHLEFDFWAFRRLRAPETLELAGGAVKRDIAKLQEALEREEMHYTWNGDEERPLALVRPHTVHEYEGHCVHFFLEYVTAVVILMNTLAFGMSTELVPDSLLWEILEVLFTIVYLVEACLKLHVVGSRNFFCGSERYWNWLDMGCLITSVIDLSVTYTAQALAGGSKEEMSGFTLVRLLRLARLARLMKALRFKMFRELKLMVMGVVSGIRVLAWAVVMLIMLLYVIGLAMKMMVGDNEPEFSTVIASMCTLFRCFTDGCSAYNGTPLAERLRFAYDWPAFAGFFLLYILICGGVFNLIMALFIDNVVNTQGERKQQDLSDSAVHTEIALKEVLTRLLMHRALQNGIPDEVVEEVKGFGEPIVMGKLNHSTVRAQFDCLCAGDIQISKNAFAVWLNDENFCEVLEQAEISISNKAILFDTMDADMGGTLTADEVFVGLMKLRGPVTKTDIVGVSLRVRRIVALLQQSSVIMESLNASLDV
eukprot:TRINITY_DN31229_c0_g1_i1.p1 TRINITY_DN31229_c0_g1~~TRINITY_DN31229_c0_g1_i1.p1  ORF type:complete len:801 (-),score=145.85 TRINITY_DN31229_c0_g1_i1:209-2554(-)